MYYFEHNFYPPDFKYEIPSLYTECHQWENCIKTKQASTHHNTLFISRKKWDKKLVSRSYTSRISVSLIKFPDVSLKGFWAFGLKNGVLIQKLNYNKFVDFGKLIKKNGTYCHFRCCNKDEKSSIRHRFFNTTKILLRNFDFSKNEIRYLNKQFRKHLKQLKSPFWAIIVYSQ